MAEAASQRRVWVAAPDEGHEAFLRADVVGERTDASLRVLLP